MVAGDLASKFKGYDDEEEEDEDEMMAVEGSDGQQYVVLEVIQLADNQGTEQVNNNFTSFGRWLKIKNKNWFCTNLWFFYYLITQMAVVANEDGDLMMQDPLSQENSLVTSGTEMHEELEEEEEEEEEMELVQLKNTITTRSKSGVQKHGDSKLRKEMENCFGFDEVNI